MQRSHRRKPGVERRVGGLIRIAGRRAIRDRSHDAFDLVRWWQRSVTVAWSARAMDRTIGASGVAFVGPVRPVATCGGAQPMVRTPLGPGGTVGRRQSPVRAGATDEFRQAVWPAPITYGY